LHVPLARPCGQQHDGGVAEAVVAALQQHVLPPRASCRHNQALQQQAHLQAAVHVRKVVAAWVKVLLVWRETRPSVALCWRRHRALQQQLGCQIG
jgi:hypothetical protein